MDDTISSNIDINVNSHDKSRSTDIRQAVLEADREHNYSLVRQANGPPASSELRDSTAKREKRQSFLDESEQETLFRFRNTFAPVYQASADTLVYIGIPPPVPGQDSFDYDFIVNQFQSPYLMQSSTLRRLQSSKIDKFLGPMSVRTERRLKKMGVHKLVRSLEGIKYYVDLSPILNDDEALIQITQLTVPAGALKWHQEAKDYCVNPDPVCGRDALEPPRKPIYKLQQSELIEDTSPDSERTGSNGETQKSEKNTSNESKQSEKKPSPFERPLEEEYTSLRHHATTVRFLQAISGSDPKLDSAAKAWTFCMLADYFDCATQPVVSNWIISWLLQHHNDQFISAHPDIAYRMAVATKSVWLMRSTFAILVGQQAMLEAARSRSEISQPKPRANKHVSTCLDDDDINRIDHAAMTLAQRMRPALDEIAQSPGVWNFTDRRDAELLKLRNVEATDKETIAALQDVKTGLQAYTQRMIYMTFSTYYAYDNKKVPEYKSCKPYATYKEIPASLRLLTRYCWSSIMYEEYIRDYLDTPNNHAIWAETKQSLQLEGIIPAGDIPYVSKAQLFEAINRLNMRLVELHRINNPSARTAAYSPVASHSIKRSVDSVLLTSVPTSPMKQVKLSPEYDQLNYVPNQSAAAPQANSTQTELRLVAGDAPAFAARNENIDAESDSEWSQGPWETTRTHTANADEPSKSSDQYISEEEWEDVIGGFSELSKESGRVDLPFRARAPALDNTSKGSVNLPSIHSLGLGQASPATLSSDLPERTRHPEGRNYIQPSNLSGRQNNALTALHNPTSDAFRAMSATEQTEAWRVYQKPTTDKAMTRSVIDQAASVYQDTSDCVESILSSNKSTADASTQTPAQPQSSYHVWDEDQPYQPRPSSSTVRSSTGKDKPPAAVPSHIQIPHYFINDMLLLSEIGTHIHRRLEPLITPGYITDRTCDFDIPVDNISTLLCLNDNEYKYLPLWAGGLDDGSGGVFDDGAEVPDAPDVGEGGFRGGAMGIIPGVGSSMGGSMAGSEFEDLGLERGESTVGKASRFATDGTATETVISMDD